MSILLVDDDSIQQIKMETSKAFMRRLRKQKIRKVATIAELSRSMVGATETMLVKHNNNNNIQHPTYHHYY